MSASDNPRRTLAFAVAALALCALALAPAAQAEFGLTDLGTTFAGPDGSPAMQAGSHPYEFTTRIGVNTKAGGGGQIPDDEARDLKIEFPPGFVGTPTPVPPCRSADFANLSNSFSACPASSQIGIVAIEVGFGPRLPGEPPEFVPVFNLVPSPGSASKIGFIVKSAPVVIETGVNPDPPYNLVTDVTSIPNFVQFYGSELTLWGVPTDPAHDGERSNCPGGGFDGCSLALPEKPFLTLPTACPGPLETSFEARSWQNPGTWTEPIVVQTDDGQEPPAPVSLTGCERLQFAPTIKARPTTTSAESATGLDFDVDFEDEGLTSGKGIAQSTIKKAVVTLPQGVTANPSLAGGLSTCSEAQLDNETALSEPGGGCPEASKIGTVEVETPLLEGVLLKGQVFLATQQENPFNSLLALYMVIKDPGLGILVKLPGRVAPDPRTGQLVTTFGEPGYEIPQFPFSHFRFHFREGSRSPLVTPPACGTYEAKAELTPWSGGEQIAPTSSFKVTSGVNGAPCPQGSPSFNPGFDAGSISNNAGSYSPFFMRLTRADGEQDMTRFSAELPPGMTAKLAGTTQCSDAGIALARSRNVAGGGKQELASPSCPASSRIGEVLGGAGVGSELTYVPGSIYMAGPYNGALLSVVAIVPAVAGPFDVGAVVTRIALRIDPRTAEVTVDGSASDPIPHILAGIPLKVRDIRVMVDRPQFTLNPTSCDPFSVAASLWGGGADVFSSADDSPASLAARFQAANCASLGFKPRLGLKLKGGTKRGAHPALVGVYRPRPVDANLKNLVLRLPRSAFLDQAHIRTICTRVQFAADACPKGAIYGRATAWTPILDEPLRGPVYLRSSNHNLPDFVAALKGLVDVEAVARIDSKRGGIRATFTEVPDAPLSKVVVRMQGAKKGLIVNSTDLCMAKKRAVASYVGHNAKTYKARPLMRVSCRAKKSNGAKRRGGARRDR